MLRVSPPGRGGGQPLSPPSVLTLHPHPQFASTVECNSTLVAVFLDSTVPSSLRDAVSGACGVDGSAVLFTLVGCSDAPLTTLTGDDLAPINPARALGGVRRAEAEAESTSLSVQLDVSAPPAGTNLGTSTVAGPPSPGASTTDTLATRLAALFNATNDAGVAAMNSTLVEWAVVSGAPTETAQQLLLWR